ncbi:hypothetical protein NMY22_g5493 [Coprinellus aureogranulatus]|nr:hypothetical protein NMY22_g5493 [Coprinellus aureogranulatus]
MPATVTEWDAIAQWLYLDAALTRGHGLYPPFYPRPGPHYFPAELCNMTYPSLSLSSLAYTTFALVIGYWLYHHNQSRKATSTISRLPLNGNNSDIIYLNVTGTSILIVNTRKAAIDLFDKRSAIYSSRAQTTMLKDLIKANWFFSFMKYGESWREHRKMFQQHFHPLDTESHQPKEQEWMYKLLKKLHDSPAKFAQHIRHVVGAITIEVTYGLDVKPSHDPYIQAAEEAVTAASAASAPGAFLVDSLPLLKYVPSWFPGAGFKRKALEWRKSMKTMVEMPFYDAERDIAAGTAPSTSFVAKCLNSLDEAKDLEEQKRVVMGTAGNFFLGGADTSVNALTTFVLLMTLHPDVQAKAQAELDRVLGKYVLPTFADEPSLPYVGAIVKEVLRWSVPLFLPPYPSNAAVPHFIEQSDVYNGYFIPRNTIVAGNAWAMHRNERDYPEPHLFRPERFLTPNGSQLDTNVPEPVALFGFGRRICPGRHMALSMMYMGIASILSVFDVSKALDEDGNTITPSGEFTSSLSSRPVPFKCLKQALSLPTMYETRRPFPNGQLALNVSPSAWIASSASSLQSSFEVALPVVIMRSEGPNRILMSWGIGADTAECIDIKATSAAPLVCSAVMIMQQVRIPFPHHLEPDLLYRKPRANSIALRVSNGVLTASQWILLCSVIPLRELRVHVLPWRPRLPRPAIPESKFVGLSRIAKPFTIHNGSLLGSSVASPHDPWTWR